MEPDTIAEILALLQQRPDDAELFQLLGKKYQKAGNIKEAREAYRRSVFLDPGDPWNHLFLSTCDQHDGRLRSALDECNLAVELLPDEAIVYACQGNAYAALGRDDLAEVAYQSALHIDPENVSTVRKLSDLVARRRRGTLEITHSMIVDAHNHDQAATTVLLAPRWLREHPDDIRIIILYADMLYQMARYEEAIQILEDALERFANARWLIVHKLGDLNRYRGNFAEAERWFLKAVEIEANEAASRIALGAVQARQGKLNDAEVTHRAGTQCSQGPVDEAFQNLGLVLRGQDRFAEAAECFREAIKLDPHYDEAIEALEDVEMTLALLRQVGPNLKENR